MTTYEWPMTGGNLARTGETVEIVNPPLRKIWEFEPDAMIQSSPAISRDLVFFGSGYASKHGSFYALEAHSGQLVWTFETAGMITSSPCISEGIVYFGSWNKKFYALEARSGKIIWEFQDKPRRDHPLAGIFRSDPVVVGGSVCIAEDALYLLDAKTGKIIWQASNPEYVGSNPAVSNGILYVGLYRELLAFDLATKEIIWRANPVSKITSGPAIAGGLVYCSAKFSILALSARTGQQVWDFQMEGKAKFLATMGIESSPAVSNGRVFFGAPDGKIYALEARTGRKIWAFKTDGEVSSRPVVSGSVVYVLSADGHFYALDAERGSKLWDFSSDSADMLGSSPAVCNRKIYIGWDKMYAFG